MKQLHDWTIDSTQWPDVLDRPVGALLRAVAELPEPLLAQLLLDQVQLLPPERVREIAGLLQGAE